MESVVYSIIGFLMATGLLVTVHEWGHYCIGRLCGVKVLSFSIGFGRTLWSRRSGADQTEWKIAALPLGGYVQFLSIRDKDNPVPPEEMHRAFEQKKTWQRIAIIAAGPVTNLIVAAVVYTIVFCTGIEQDRPRFASPLQQSLLAQAGLHEAGELVSWDDQSIRSLQDLQWMWFKQLGHVSGQARVGIKTSHGVSKQFLIRRALLPQSENFSAWLDTLGMEPDMPSIPPVIAQVLVDHPAQRVGLKAGDRIISIGNKPINEWSDLLEALKPQANHPLRLKYLRAGVQHEVSVTPEAVLEQGGGSVGKIGIVPEQIKIKREDYRVLVRYSLPESITRAVYKTYDLSHMTLLALYKMFAGQLSWKNVSGPGTIAELAGNSLQAGWVVYLNFLGLISVSLGIMNLLPIPVLDGGHILYEFAGILRGGNPVSMKWVMIGQKVGLVMLGALMFLAFYNDWQRFFK